MLPSFTKRSSMYESSSLSLLFLQEPPSCQRSTNLVQALPFTWDPHAQIHCNCLHVSYPIHPTYDGQEAIMNFDSTCLSQLTGPTAPKTAAHPARRHSWMPPSLLQRGRARSSVHLAPYPLYTAQGLHHIVTYPLSTGPSLLTRGCAIRTRHCTHKLHNMPRRALARGRVRRSLEGVMSYSMKGVWCVETWWITNRARCVNPFMPPLIIFSALFWAKRRPAPEFHRWLAARPYYSRLHELRL
jgi:hypothetical protein